jgi:outer membrane PBP1 activator LpoA protein
LTLLGGIAWSALPAAAHPAPSTQAAVADAAANTGDCGSVELGASGTDAATLKNAANCLQNAFSNCQTAQLHATWTDGDGSVDRVFFVTQGEAACEIAEMVTHGSATSGTQSSDTYRCAGVSTDANGITIRGCGPDGDVKIPTASQAASM